MYIQFVSFQFRKQVSDVLKPHHDDYFLIRWLRGKLEVSGNIEMNSYLCHAIFFSKHSKQTPQTGIILCIGPANERLCYKMIPAQTLLVPLWVSYGVPFACSYILKHLLVQCCNVIMCYIRLCYNETCQKIVTCDNLSKKYHQTSDISHTKSPNLIASRLIL